MLAGYAADAAELVTRYEAISPAELYAPVADVLPVRPARIVDVGAGTGRDAAWFAAAGHEVVAVEPVTAFRDAGRARHAGLGVRWIDDRLPELSRLEALRAGVDCVLLSGVWQHLDEDARATAMPRLAALLRPGGLLVLSVRRGPGPPIRPCFTSSPDEAAGLARETGLSEILRRDAPSRQAANQAAGVAWTWLAFRCAG